MLNSFGDQRKDTIEVTQIRFSIDVLESYLRCTKALPDVPCQKIASFICFCFNYDFLFLGFSQIMPVMLNAS